jgi:penicillin-binding protein 1C
MYRLKQIIHKKRKKIKRAAIILAAFMFFLFFPIKKPLVRSDYSRVITDRNGEIIRVFLTRDEQYCLPPDFHDTVPEKLKKAVIEFEDRYFYFHPGINPVSIVRATVQNIRNRRVVSGASTITMQLARLRKGRDRKIFNKILEMFEAIRIEAHFSKNEILKVYLDNAPYGGNVLGYQAASWRFFGKPPGKLSWAEASLLAVLPNSPGQMNTVKNNDLLRQKRNRLLVSLYNEKMFDTITLRNSIDEPIPGAIVPFDLLAPHLTRRLNNQISNNQRIICTSIDAELQKKATYLVQRYSRFLEHYGIENSAAIIIENKTRKVRAYVGSQDFYGKSGKVDGVLAMRSSGSLLKPFLYALAVQNGLILPQSVLQDIPTYYGSFSPHNASEMYTGMVTAHEALVRSLNVPAVRLLYTYGHYRFYNFLKEGGISTLFRSADNYGLPLIIGGAEVTLEEVSGLFCGLGNLGNFGPVSFFEQPGQTNNKKYLIDSLSCVLILNTLKDLRRPGAEYYWTKFNNQYPIAWKTGTSYGHKDAWAVGVNPEYTIGVWVGNFNAETNKNLSGAGSAGPLLFDLFDMMPDKGSWKVWWNTDDYNFNTVDVCAVTGYLATNKCRKTSKVLAPFREKLKPCPYHIKTEVDSTGKFSVCSRCWQGGHHSSSYLSYPPLVLNYMRKNGLVIERIPPHNPDCKVNRSNEMIDIDYPKNKSKIYLSRDFDGKLQPVIFSAVHQLPDQILYWYLDNNYIGMTNHQHKITCIPERGQHTLTIVDSYGNSKKINFYSTRTE